MSATEAASAFVTWEERVICHERGNRVIHFYLKDESGNSVLAVVGTERSVRHMMYVVPDHFLQAYGSTHSISSCKWRARREVVEWLTCLVTKDNPHHSDEQLDDAAQALESLKISTAGISANDKLISRKLKFQSSDIEWSGIPWFCAKQLKHYSGFWRNGTPINVHSFVYIMAEAKSHYLGYLEDMYEDKKKQKKVKVRWFHHGQEVKQVIPQLNLEEGEVFITPNVQVISAECVNGPAIILTPKHYEKCVAAMLHNSLSEIHICSRQFKNNKLKPFTLTKLRGYSNQPVVSCLNSLNPSKRKVNIHKFHTEDDEDFAQDDPTRFSNKKHKSGKDYQVLENGSTGLHDSSPVNEMKKCQQKYLNLKLKLSRKTMGIKVIEPKPQRHFSFNVDEKIEVLCQDSGIRGCWFICKILCASQRQLKVQYDDLLDVDGPEKLQEWISAYRVAAPDKLGMRCPGRLIVRPCPPNDTAATFEVGAPVDAWWSEGWWEGVITAVDVGGAGTVHVYTPGEEKYLMVEKKDIRISRDWIDNSWVDIVGKPGICSYLSSNGGINRVRLSTNSAVVDGSMSDCSGILESKSSSIPKFDVPPKVETELSALEAPDELESMKGLTLMGPLHAIDEDRDIYTGGGNDGVTNNVVDDDDRKTPQTVDDGSKDVAVDGDTGNDDDGGDNAEEDNEDKLVEENFDSAEASKVA